MAKAKKKPAKKKAVKKKASKRIQKRSNDGRTGTTGPEKQKNDN